MDKSCRPPGISEDIFKVAADTYRYRVEGGHPSISYDLWNRNWLKSSLGHDDLAKKRRIMWFDNVTISVINQL